MCHLTFLLLPVVLCYQMLLILRRRAAELDMSLTPFCSMACTNWECQPFGLDKLRCVFSDVLEMQGCDALKRDSFQGRAPITAQVPPAAISKVLKTISLCAETKLAPFLFPAAAESLILFL